MSHFLRRHPLGRLLHQCLVWTLIVAMTDANAQTLTGRHVLHGAQALLVPSSPGFRSAASTTLTRAVPSVAFNSPSFLANLSLPAFVPPSRSVPNPSNPTPESIQRNAAPQLLRLAQAAGTLGPIPSDPACFDAVARPKPGKVQVDWNPVAWAERYEVYRGSDTDPVVFQKVGDAASNLSTFLDANVPNEQTFLYFVRALGGGVACDSTVASAHPTTRRGTFNYPPVLYSTPVTQGLAGALYRYHLRASDPYPGDPVRYEVVEGPEGMDIDPTTGWVDWQTVVGVHRVTLLADDGRGGNDLQSFLLQVTQSNRAPLADAGPGRVVHVTTPVILDGTGSSDLDGDPLGFEWFLESQPTGGTAVLDGADSPTPGFIPNQIGTYRFRLVVHDGQVGSEPAFVEIVADNASPVANAGPDQRRELNATVQLDGGGSTDPDGDAITYRWSMVKRPAGSQAQLSSESAVRPTFTADRRGEFTLELIVDDGFVESLPDRVTITIANSVPIADAGPDQSVTLNAVVSLDGSRSSDLDGDPLSYRWVLVTRPPGSDAKISGEGSVRPTFTADRRGDFVIRLVVHDGESDSEPDEVTVSTVNSAPIANAGPDQTAPVLQTVTLDGSKSSDPDNDPLTYQWTVAQQPAGSSVRLSDATAAQPTFQIPVPGDYVFELVVDDGFTTSVKDSVTVSTINSRPVAKAGADQEVRAGTLVMLDGSGSTDVDQDPLTHAWAILSSPDPNAVPALNAPDSATPSFVASLPGLYVVQLIVHDGATNSEPDTLTVTVVPALVAVPDVVGMPQGQAESTIVNATLAVGAVTTAYHATVPAGRVISQNPLAGTLVEPGTAVGLVISLGPPLVAVPDVVGELQADAEQRITTATLTVGGITRAFHPTVPLGRVLGQDPVGGTLVLPATSVALVISLGPEVVCPFAPGEFAQWQTTVAPVPEGKTLGSVAPATPPECALILREGDSFEITAQRTFTLPAEPGMLVIAYETPSFDTTATGAIRDAFEVALVDGARRPLTFTIQGSSGLPPVAGGLPAPLPPSPDALFNQTEGLPPFVAAGAAYVPGPTNTLAIDLRSLAPGSNARVILRLVNNDGDSETRVVVREIAFVAFDPSVDLGGSPIPGLTLMRGSSGDFASSGISDRARPGCIGDSTSQLSEWTPSTREMGHPFVDVGTPTQGASVAPATMLLSGNARVGTISDYALPGQTVGSLEVFFDEDKSTYPPNGLNDVPRPVTPRSRAVASKFLSRFLHPRTETFESHPPGSIPSNLSFGDVSASLTGSVSVFEELDPTATGDGGFPFSGTRGIGVGGRQQGQDLFFSLRFSKPQSAFGFYGADVEVNRFRLIFEGADGIRRAAPVNVTLPQGSGGAFYFGVIDREHPFVSAEFQNLGGASDGFTFDDFTIGQPDELQPVSPQNRIIRVTVNGALVDALDPGGNFFSRIQVQPGGNRFEIVATDALDQSTTNTIEVFGTTCIENFASLGEVSTALSPEYGRTSFNDWTEVLYSELSLRNTGTEALGTPLYVGVTRITGAGVELLAPDGVTAADVPFYDFSSAVSGGSLAPGSVSAARTLAFSNPNRTQFTYELVILGRRNQPPTITSLPTVTATGNRAYSYDADATDPDNDPLTYTLVSGPSGLAIAPSNGMLTWSPSDSDLGTHDITLRVDDGRGGSAEQRYVLSVTTPPANRPPYFTSQPVTVYETSLVKARGRLILAADEWALADNPGSGVFPEDPPNDLAPFARNIAGWFLERSGMSNGRFHAYSDNWAFSGLALKRAMEDNGHQWSTGTQEFPFTLENLVKYDGIFLAGDSVDSEVLQEFLRQGGNVYLATATGVGGAANEAQRWNAFLEDFGIELLPEYYGVGSQGAVLIDEQHALFRDVDHLALGNGQYIRISNSSIYKPAALIASIPPNLSEPQTVFAVFDLDSEIEETPYRYDADAIDPDLDSIDYSLLAGPDGMRIDAATGSIYWMPTPDWASRSSNPAPDLTLPSVSGYEVEIYANVEGPAGLSFDPAGYLFAGHDCSAPCNEILSIHKIAPQGSQSELFGQPVQDPDTVIVDSAGRFSGTVGAVLTGGSWFGSSGVIQSIGPDRIVRTVYQPTGLLGDPTSLCFDNLGRLLLVDRLSGNILISDGGAPRVLVEHGKDGVNGASLAIGGDGSIYFATADGVIRSYDSDGRLIDPAFKSGLGASPQIVFGDRQAFGTGLFVANRVTGDFWRIGRDGVADLVGSGFSNVTEMEFGPDGALYVSEYLKNRILRVVPSRTVPGLRPNQYPVTIVAADGRGGSAIQSFVIDVLPPIGNRPPEIVSEPVESVYAGSTYQYPVVALDPDGDELAFTLIEGPSGMTVRPSNGAVEWTVPGAESGPWPVKVRVTDGKGGQGEQVYAIGLVAPGRGEIHGTVYNDTNLDGLPTHPRSVELRFDSLPSTQGWTYRAQGGGVSESQVFSTTGISLVQNSVGTGSVGRGYLMYSYDSLMEPLLPFEISFRAKVLEVEDLNRVSPLNHFGFHVGLQAGPNWYGIGIGPDVVVHQKSVRGVGEYGVLANLDVSDFHDYRIKATPGDAFQLSIDGIDVTTVQPLVYIQPFALTLGDTTAGENARAEVAQYRFTQFPEDPRVVGHLVYIDSNSNGVRDREEPSAATGIDGRYAFTGLLPGVHTVRYERTPGWTPVMPASGMVSVTITGGEVVRDVDFLIGRIPAGTGGLRGAVFVDLNRDGVRGAVSPRTGSVDVTKEKILLLTGNGEPNSVGPVLQSLGYSVVVRSLNPGSLVAVLGSDPSFTQVWVWNDGTYGNSVVPPDVSRSFSAEDLRALSTFSKTHDKWIMDGLSWRKHLTQDEGNLTKNEALNLSIAGGGVVLGADDSPIPNAIVQHVNQVAAYFGFDLFAGVYDTPPSIQSKGGSLFGSPYLVNANALNSSTTTYSEIPHGFQQNGVFLATALFGSPATPSPGYGSPVLAGDVIGGVSYEHVNHLVTTSIPGGGLDGVPEPGLSGWIVYLDEDDNGRRDVGEAFAITDGSGSYAFLSLASGTYVVRQEPKRGWRLDAPASGEHEVSLGVGEKVFGLDFANTELPFGPGNLPPLLASVPPGVAVHGSRYLYRPVATDGDGDVLAFELVTKPSGMVLDPSSGITVWRPDSAQVGTHDVVLRVQDGRGGVDVQAWQIQVVPGNTAPVITTVPPSPAVAEVAYQYEIRAQDAENDEITLSLAAGPAGMTLEGVPPPAVLPPGLTWSATAGVRWTPSSAQIGDHPVVVLATDARGAESLQSFTLSVVATAPNDPPVFTSTPRRTVRAGTPYVYVVAASDPNGDPLEFRTPTLPSGMTLESTGSALSRELRWSPTPAQIGSHPVTLEVADGRGGVATQSFTLEVVTEAFNGSPIITSIAKTSAVVDRVYAYNATAEDPDADPVIWELVTGPAGMSIDARRGAIRWNPTLDALGTHPVTLRVTDPLGATGEQSFDLQVRAANQPPAIVSFPLTEATVGELFLYGVRATDGEGDAITFRIVTGPAGASLATVPGTAPGTAVGNLSWTPTLGQVGFQTVIVEANDGNGGVASQNFVVLVTDQPKNRPPAITSIPVTTARPEQPYQYEVRASDPDGGTLNFQLVTAPAGMTIGTRLSATGIPVLWTPTSSQVGAHDVAITALDAQGAGARQRFTVTVRANQAPLIQSTPPTTVLAGTTYRYGVRAADPDGDRLRYELTEGPAGMAVDAYGVVSWSTAATGAGTHPVRVQVSDPYGATVSQAFEVAVQADTQAPTVTLQIAASMSDDQGRKVVEIQKPVRIRATAADNVAVQTLRLRAGGEERVLDANGDATVTFTSPAFVDVVATAADAAGNTGTAQETIRVVDLTASGSPVLTIESPSDDNTVTQPTPVRIRISSASPLVEYKVEYANAADIDLSNIAGNNAAFTLLRRVALPADTRDVPTVEAAVFDPTILINDSYLIRVTASDINNQQRVEGVLVHVQGNLKFGEFRLEFTDLAVPVAGIPIQISRVYDSRLSKRSGDFGHGWSLGVRDAQIRETLRERTLYGGSRVYLNAPDGRRIGFTVQPELVGSFGFTFVRARFKPDPGVYDRLEIIGDPIAIYYQGLFLGGLGDEDFDPSLYRLTTKDGTVYDYDQSAGLQRVVDSNANRLVFTRDGVFHYLSGETAPDQSVPFTRDARGRITQITDPAGNALRYTYDAAGDLRTFTDQEANVTQYGYDIARPHFLASIIDPLGRQALTVIYDATGRLESVVDASGNPIQQALDTDTNIGTLTDARGNQTFLHYDDQGNEIARIVPGISTNLFAYDRNNNLTNAINARGGVTNFTYDAQGNVTSITDPSGATTTMTYNNQGKPTKVVNALGQTLALQYNGAGQLLEVINNAGHRTVMARDGQGRVTSLTDAAGNTTQFEYDGGCACGRPGKVISPDGSFRLYEYTSQGQTNRVVNELGAETLFDYDSTGRLLSTRDALGNETRFLYRGPLLTNIVDALGRSTRYEYDAQNRTNKIIDAEGGVVEFRYDANGNRTHVIDPVGNDTQFVYDADNRLIQQIDPLGHISRFAYDAAGNRIEAIDRNGRRRYPSRQPHLTGERSVA